MALRHDRAGSSASRGGNPEGADRGSSRRDRPDREPPGEETRLPPDEREGRVPRGRNRDDDRTWTPWTLIRYKELDAGARSIPDGEVFWASPDIWVETPDPAGNPIAGRPTFVHARIINLGKAWAYPVCVDFYWGDPSPSFGPGNMNHLGTEWVDVAAHAVKDVRCSVPWTPFRVNDGHECLMVNFATPIYDWNKIVPRYPFQPKHDRRVGQRNVTVLPADAGATLGFAIGVNNLFPMTAMATVMARTAHVAIDRQAPETLSQREIVNRVAVFDGSELRDPLVRDVTEGQRVARSVPRISGGLDERSHVVPFPEARTYLANLLAAGRAASREAASDGVLVSLSMKAFEQRRVRLELGVPADARRGEFVLFHVSQRLEGFTVGGYTIVVEIS